MMLLQILLRHFVISLSQSVNEIYAPSQCRVLPYSSTEHCNEERKKKIFFRFELKNSLILFHAFNYSFWDGMKWDGKVGGSFNGKWSRWKYAILLIASCTSFSAFRRKWIVFRAPSGPSVTHVFFSLENDNEQWPARNSIMSQPFGWLLLVTENGVEAIRSVFFVFGAFSRIF